jgi:hypothetical protein
MCGHGSAKLTAGPSVLLRVSRYGVTGTHRTRRKAQKDSEGWTSTRPAFAKGYGGHGEPHEKGSKPWKFMVEAASLPLAHVRNGKSAAGMPLLPWGRFQPLEFFRLRAFAALREIILLKVISPKKLRTPNGAIPETPDSRLRSAEPQCRDIRRSGVL